MDGLVHHATSVIPYGKIMAEERTFSIKKGKAFILVNRHEWIETKIKDTKMHQFIYSGKMKVYGIRCIIFSDENLISWAQPEFIAMDKNNGR